MDLRLDNEETRIAANKYLEEANKKYPEKLVRVGMPELASASQVLIEVWRSKYFLVQIYKFSEDVERITVNRTAINSSGDWLDNISWDELQSLKEQCGRGEFEAVEIYPKSSDVVNVANMRHLWVFRGEGLPFVWRKEDG